jgi:hypothetical protein
MCKFYNMLKFEEFLNLEIVLIKKWLNLKLSIFKIVKISTLFPFQRN